MYKNADKLIAAMEQETEAFYKKVDTSRRLDNSFAHPNDVPLTKEEIAEIDRFWGKYSFAYPNIDYTSFQSFKNRCGKFDVRHCPGSVRTSYMTKYFNNAEYNTAFQNKAMLSMLYPDMPQPRTLFRRMNGIFYNENYEPISLDQIVDGIVAYLAEDDLIAKLNFTSGGKGVFFLRENNACPDFIRNFLTVKLGGGAFVIQEVLKQSDFMAALNPSSVNTIRITTLLHKGKIHHLAALIRIGGSGSEVDNWCSGGSLLGIDIETGKCNSWAVGNDCTRVTRLRTKINLSTADLVVPNFQQVKDMVARAHYRIPYIKMISWDIALKHDDTPVMIECNFGGMIQLHQAATGPLFGDLSEALYDEYLLKLFYTRFATQKFLCKEYHDHVVISEYIGKEKSVSVPLTLRDKPVTLIERNAFKGCEVKEVTTSATVQVKSINALAGIPRKFTYNG